MKPVEKLLGKLGNVESTSSGWSARCPAHSDERNSLSVSEGADGRALVHCHAHCPPLNICRAVGLTLADLMPSRNGSNGRPPIIAEYDYRDEHDTLLYQTVRFAPKDFRQRRPDGNGGWNWTTKDVRKVLYRLPQLRAADHSLPVYITEGEKDADRLAELGLIATCNVGGAGKWRDEYVEHLRGRRVVIFPDNDDPGRKHAEQVARSLAGAAADVQIITTPGAKDISDWLGDHRERDEVDRLIQRRRGIDRRRWKHVFGAGDERGVSPSPSSPKDAPPRPTIFVPIPVADLIRQHPTLRTPIIEGLCRQGETLNVIAPPKVGKSWLVLSLAFSVANGEPWLGRFPVRQGRVLILDNELHRETIAFRAKRVAEAMGLPLENIDIISLRGKGGSYATLQPLVESWGKQYDMIIVDSHYRMLGGVEENANTGVTDVYNLIDRYSEMTGACWVPIHHSSKGDQSEKDVTDVGSGAGSQARATDTHMIIRRHETDRCFVLEAVTRSFPQPDPVVLKWDFPVWAPAYGLNPKQLENTSTKKRKREDEAKKDEIVSLLRTDGPMARRSIYGPLGMGDPRCLKLLNELIDEGRVRAEDADIRGNRTQQYSVAGGK
ncbi:MAG: AAA family ATPase [Planctomycetales bacterium]